MKIFIAGARSITNLNDAVKNKMFSIYSKGYDVLVGDCYGVDASVQKFYSELGYKNVTVYASNGKTRNNIGLWNVKNIVVPNNIRGFDFYCQKDIAMAKEANMGFMIWDGKSRGTLNNIITMITQSKTVVVYYAPRNKMIVIKDASKLDELIKSCDYQTRILYSKLTNSVSQCVGVQLSLM